MTPLSSRRRPDTLRFLAEPEVLDASLVLKGLHFQGSMANKVGIANLKVLAQALMEKVGVDELIVQGAIPTTGATQVTGRAQSGSPATYVLRLPMGPCEPKRIDSMGSLARRGLTVLQAKQTIEALLEGRHVVVALPMVEDPDMLIAELAASGISAAVATAHVVAPAYQP